MLGSSSKDQGHCSLLSAPLGHQGRDLRARWPRAPGACGTGPGALTWLGSRGRAGEQAGGIRAWLRPACRAEREGAGPALRLHCGTGAPGVRPARSKSQVKGGFQPPARGGTREAVELPGVSRQTHRTRLEQGGG